MQMLREIVEPPLVALSEIGVSSDFWKNALVQVGKNPKVICHCPAFLC